MLQLLRHLPNQRAILIMEVLVVSPRLLRLLLHLNHQLQLKKNTNLSVASKMLIKEFSKAKSNVHSLHKPATSWQRSTEQTFLPFNTLTIASMERTPITISLEQLQTARMVREVHGPIVSTRLLKQMSKLVLKVWFPLNQNLQ